MDDNFFAQFALIVVLLEALAWAVDSYAEYQLARMREKHLKESAQRARLELVSRAGVRL